MTLEDFIKQLRKAAGRGNNEIEVKFYQYDELALSTVFVNPHGQLVLGFGKPLVEGWEKDYVLNEVAYGKKPAPAAVIEETEAVEEVAVEAPL